MPVIHKVTCFIFRKTGEKLELLLFNHPNAGVQIPAGTANAGEDMETAAKREAAEESGIENLALVRSLGEENDPAPPGFAIISSPTRIYSRPDPTSYDWASLRAGIVVKVLRKIQGFTHVMYEEYDRLPNPQYTTYTITGWVPDEVLTEQRIRHYFLFKTNDVTPDRWKVSTDHHVFELFWAAMNNLPAIIPPQDGWLKWLKAINFGAIYP